MTYLRAAVSIVPAFWLYACIRIAANYHHQSKTETSWAVIHGVVMTAAIALMYGPLLGL